MQISSDRLTIVKINRATYFVDKKLLCIFIYDHIVTFHDPSSVHYFSSDSNKNVGLESRVSPRTYFELLKNYNNFFVYFQ